MLAFSVLRATCYHSHFPTLRRHLLSAFKQVGCIYWSIKKFGFSCNLIINFTASFVYHDKICVGKCMWTQYNWWKIYFRRYRLTCHFLCFKISSNARSIWPDVAALVFWFISLHPTKCLLTRVEPYKKNHLRKSLLFWKNADLYGDIKMSSGNWLKLLRKQCMSLQNSEMVL
jgi:hypothetical protein